MKSLNTRHLPPIGAEEKRLEREVRGGRERGEEKECEEKGERHKKVKKEEREEEGRE